MAKTVTNQSTTTYSYNGSSEVYSVTSNENAVVLENQAGLTITKSSNRDSFVAGSIITYTVNITNNSGQFFTGVRIIDNLGGGNLAYVLGSARLTVGSLTYPVNPVSTNPLTFTLQQLNVGQSMTLTYNAQVIFNLPSSVNSITNTLQGIGYTSTGTITGYASETIQRACGGNLVLNKTASQTTVYPNQVFNYFLTLTNNSGEVVNVVSVVDQLPEDFVVTGVWLRIGSGPNLILDSQDYTISSGNLLTIPSTSGPNITVPQGSTTLITISGYFN